jgi:hypothetical protein
MQLSLATDGDVRVGTVFNRLHPHGLCLVRRRPEPEPPVLGCR